MAASPFTPKILKHMADGKKACQDCQQIAQILRAAGVPNEPLEAQAEYQSKVLAEFERLHSEILAKPEV